MENILALDLGTKCGWAFLHYDCGFVKVMTSGVWDLKPKITESIGQRYVKFKSFLRTNCDLHDLIVYEEVHSHAGVDAAHVFGGLQAILQAHCIEHGIQYRGYGVKTIKKYATGNGNAKKEDMICAAALKWPFINIIDDNHADALWLLDLAVSDSTPGSK